MRTDVDDVYELLNTTSQAVTSISATQRRHGNRLEQAQHRIEEAQREQGDKRDAILTLLRGERPGE